MSAEAAVPALVRGPWTKEGARVIQITAGYTFSLFLTDAGKVYTAGSTEHGQLGNGTTGERIVKTGKSAFDVMATPSEPPPHQRGAAAAGG